MSNIFSTALLITAIGMGLVFVSLILLWWLMEAMVFLFKDRSARLPAPAAPSDGAEQPSEGAQTLVELGKYKAAAAAVAFALAQPQKLPALPEPEISTSGWQLAQRTRSFARQREMNPRPAQRKNP